VPLSDGVDSPGSDDEQDDLLRNEEPEGGERRSSLRVADERPESEQAGGEDDETNYVRLSFCGPPNTGNESDAAVKDEEDTYSAV
jgi:hypothetical protein